MQIIFVVLGFVIYICFIGANLTNESGRTEKRKTEQKRGKQNRKEENRTEKNVKYKCEE